MEAAEAREEVRKAKAKAQAAAVAREREQLEDARRAGGERAAERLQMSFMYDAPPGLEAAEGVGEGGDEAGGAPLTNAAAAARRARAERAPEAARRQPLGRPREPMTKCPRCGKFGHRAGDPQCEARQASAARAEAWRARGLDPASATPLELARSLAETRYGGGDARAENQQLVAADGPEGAALDALVAGGAGGAGVDIGSVLHSLTDAERRSFALGFEERRQEEERRRRRRKEAHRSDRRARGDGRRGGGDGGRDGRGEGGAHRRRDRDRDRGKDRDRGRDGGEGRRRGDDGERRRRRDSRDRERDARP